MKCLKLHEPSCIGLVNVQRCVAVFSASIRFTFVLYEKKKKKKSFCEQIIASENETVRWTTPLGLPVVQPYLQMGTKLVSLP